MQCDKCGCDIAPGQAVQTSREEFHGGEGVTRTVPAVLCVTCAAAQRKTARHLIWGVGLLLAGLLLVGLIGWLWG
jgi:hypothetical protein